MKIIKSLFVILLLSPTIGSGQSNTLFPTVLSSTGAYDTAGGFNLSYTVGEAVVTTLFTPPDFYLTQGFQQPERVQALNVNLNITNESCINTHDGIASVLITGGVGPYKITWSSDSSLNASTIDSLYPGNYTVTVKAGNGLSSTSTFTILAGESPCLVKIYNGITPNGDGHNDTWVIDYINLFPGNQVSIYNRWGSEVWSASGYDNSKVVWKGDNSQGQPLPDGTYFYIVNIGSGNPLKGWVQLTR
jgi:gliding motility-associated-like protein